MEINAIIQWIDTLEKEEVLFKIGGELEDEQYFFYLQHPDEIHSEFTDFTVVDSDYNALMADLREEFAEGEQNRFRNDDFISFEEWLNDKIESE